MVFQVQFGHWGHSNKQNRPKSQYSQGFPLTRQRKTQTITSVKHVLYQMVIGTLEKNKVRERAWEKPMRVCVQF